MYRQLVSFQEEQNNKKGKKTILKKFHLLLMPKELEARNNVKGSTVLL